LTSALIRSDVAFSKISFSTASDRMAASNCSLLSARAELSRGVGIVRKCHLAEKLSNAQPPVNPARTSMMLGGL
jgi:hypothetical protein